MKMSKKSKKKKKELADFIDTLELNIKVYQGLL